MEKNVLNLPGQSNIEELRSVVITRANDENQTEENLTKAANDLYLAPFTTKEKIEAFFKNDKTAYKLLISELSSNNLIEDFYTIIHNIKTQASFKDFITYKDKNYYQFFVEKTEFNKDFTLDETKFKNLMNFISRICYDGHGKCEILFNLLFNNTTLISDKDLYVDNNHVELKSSIGKISGGLIKGNKQINHPMIILNTIKDCLKEDINVSVLDDCTTSGINGFKNIVNILRENNIEDRMIIDSVAMGIFLQFFNMKNFNQFMMFINRIKFDKEKLAEQLFRLHGVCAIINYKITCKWEYLCVCDVDSGKYLIIDVPKVENIDDISWKDYKVLYDNEDIYFRNGPATMARDERGYVSSIYCV